MDVKMHYLISLLTFSLALPALAGLTVTDKDKLATVTLHTERINSSKRVYLAADFEATHKAGLISCDLTVQHKNGSAEGPSYTLQEDTTLMPNEKIPFNLGLFPESFHASGLDVKATLACRRVTFFSKKATKPLLKATERPSHYCCRLSVLRIVCATEPNADIEVNGTEFNLPASDAGGEQYPSCYP